MNQQQNDSTQKLTEEADVQGRRDLVRKLGKFAAYAAPFTVLALKGNATGGGSGSGGISSTSPRSQARKR